MAMRQDLPPGTAAFNPAPNNRKRCKAHRYSDEEWESHKDEIVQLYKTLSKEDVVREMNRRGFLINVRQLGYRLRDKWRVDKYHTSGNSDKTGSGERTKFARKKPNKIPAGPLTPPSSASSKSSSPIDRGQGELLRDLSCPKGFKWPRSASYGMSLSKIRALADFFLSVEDDGQAFSLYEHIDRQESDTNGSTWVSRVRNVIALARSADTPENMASARRRLQDTIEPVTDRRELTFVLKAFGAYMYARSLDPTDTPVARAQTSEAVNTLREPKSVASDLPELGTQIDMLTMLGLCWALGARGRQAEEDNEDKRTGAAIKAEHLGDDIAGAWREADIKSFREKLPGFVDLHNRRQPNTPVLRECLTWLQDQLRMKRVSIPSTLQDIGCLPKQERWKDSFELYFSVWLRWWKDGGDDGWSKYCERDLGISASEFLSVLLPVVLGPDATGLRSYSGDSQNPVAPQCLTPPLHQMPMPDSEGDSEDATVASPGVPVADERRLQLLLRAEHGVEALAVEAARDEASVWGKLLFRFFRQNWILHLDAEDQVFKKNILSAIHGWINKELLDVEPEMSLEFESSDPDTDTEMSDCSDEIS